MKYTRRDAAKLALASIPAVRALAAPNSRINGVQIGVITYSFRPLEDIDQLVRTIAQLGISEVELMSNAVEASAGAPGAGFGAGRGGTPQEQAERAGNLRKWRLSASMDRFKPVRQKFDSAGIDLALLCFNMRDGNTDEEIDYAFRMAQTLGVRAITTSTTLSMSKRIAPLADRYKMLVGYHGHDQTSDPNEFATLESYGKAFEYSKYNGINLDIGHFTASNYDAVAFIKEHHARITNLHLKDRKRDHGPNVPWGMGDTPLKDVLRLLKAEKYSFPGNIELEYPVPAGSDAATEVGKCLKYCQQALA
jgi:sugar phosphate isomerase/epimerase